MIKLILLLIYVVSIIGMRYISRLHSSKHYDIWLDRDCKVALLWFIPFFNTIAMFILGVALFFDILKRKENKKNTLNKWFNLDL